MTRVNQVSQGDNRILSLYRLIFMMTRKYSRACNFFTRNLSHGHRASTYQL